MAEPPAVDASPIICLARSGMLDLLQVEGPRVIVPSAVAEEVTRGSRAAETIAALEDRPWIVVGDPLPCPPSVLAWDLDPGESAVLAWALAHRGTVAILDDLVARRCAKALGVPLCGTLGLVLRARQRGLIPSAREAVEKLLSAGLYLSESVIRQVLALVGE